jgi:hypothetical protein
MSTYGQKRAAAAGPAIPRIIAFDKLADFVNDFDHRKPGDRFIVTGVPMPRSITFDRPYNMYRFEPDPEGGVATAFYTSLAVKKVFAPSLDSATPSLRVSCTLLEFAGEFDVYRTAFATKVEGIDEKGNVMWTADGTAPLKVKFRQ